jgi:hypothetical protein
MSVCDPGAQSIASVGENICQALEQWDSSNTAFMRESEALLERSAADLRKFHDSVSAGSAPAPAVRLELLNIKSSVNRFLRVVDAASAFVAGMSGMTTDRGIFYDASGAARDAGSVDGVPIGGQAACRTF